MFLPLIRTRRSIRRYTDESVTDEVMDQIVEAALRAPSSRGFNPWEFIVVRDKDQLARLAKAKPHGASFLRNAAAAIVVLADPERCDVWVEDASIATIFIHLAAASLGLGSCWIQIRKRMHSETVTAEAYVAQVLGIPDNRVVEAMVALGYAAEEKKPHGEDYPEMAKVFAGQYGNPYR